MNCAKLFFGLVLLCLVSTCFLKVDAQTKRRRTPRTPTTLSASITTASGLTYLITKKGTGRQPKAGETVVLQYTGTLTDGVKFDSSRDNNQPFAFKLGAGRVIKGYDEGVARLRVGDQAILVIPSNLGYGAKGVPGVIPPNSTLIFIVEIVDVKARSMSDVLATTLRQKGVEAMIAEFHNVKNSGDTDLYITESEMNAFGYQLLRTNRTSEAIAVLKLNVESYPQSANAYDSLGEAYMAHGDKEKAIENYERALAIDPKMESATQALKKLREQ